MILIWQGAGILVAMIWFFSIFAGDRLAKVLFGTDVSGGLCNLTGEWLAATLTLGLALLVRRRRGLGHDPDGGREVEVPASHSLFFIPVIAWPVIFFGLGIVAYYNAPKRAPAPNDEPPPASAKGDHPPPGEGAGPDRSKPRREDGKAAAREESVRRLKELRRKSEAALEKLEAAKSRPKDDDAKE